MWKHARRIRIEGNARLWVIGLVALFEAALVGIIWSQSQARAQIAYLMKVGSKYVLAWKDTDMKYDSVVYASLGEAIQFADELGLRRGRNILDSGDVEYLSFNDRPAGYVVQWKIFSLPYVHQMTFNSQSDAKYFADSIRGGSYSPSPFGHSLLFVPKPN